MIEKILPAPRRADELRGTAIRTPLGRFLAIERRSQPPIIEEILRGPYHGNVPKGRDVDLSKGEVARMIRCDLFGIASFTIYVCRPVEEKVAAQVREHMAQWKPMAEPPI